MKLVFKNLMLLLFFFGRQLEAHNDEINFNQTTLTKQVYEHYIKPNDPYYLSWNDFRLQLSRRIDSNNVLVLSRLIPRLEQYQQLQEVPGEFHINQVLTVTSILNQIANLPRTNLNQIDPSNDSIQRNTLKLFLMYCQLESASIETESAILKSILTFESFHQLLIIYNEINQISLQPKEESEVIDSLRSLIVIFNQIYKILYRESGDANDFRIKYFFKILSSVELFLNNYERHQDNHYRIYQTTLNSIQLFYVIQQIVNQPTHSRREILQYLYSIREILNSFSQTMNDELTEARRRSLPEFQGVVQSIHIEDIMVIIMDMMKVNQINQMDRYIYQLIYEFDHMFFRSRNNNIYRLRTPIEYGFGFSDALTEALREENILTDSVYLYDDRSVIVHSVQEQEGALEATSHVTPTRIRSSTSQAQYNSFNGTNSQHAHANNTLLDSANLDFNQLISLSMNIHTQ